MDIKTALNEINVTSGSNVTTVLIFIFVFLAVYLVTRKPTGIPPGPVYTLPFLGDLLLMAKEDVLKTFRKLRKKHGDIFSFYMGKELLVVINGHELIEKAAVKKGHYFSSRPKNYLNNVHAAGKGIIFASGPFWKRQRKFVSNHLQSFGFGKRSFEDKILTEVKAYIDELSTTEGKSFDIQTITQTCVSNVVLSIVCGKRYHYDDPTFQSILKGMDEDAKAIMKVSVALNCFPFLRYLPGDLLHIKASSTGEALYYSL